MDFIASYWYVWFVANFIAYFNWQFTKYEACRHTRVGLLYRGQVSVLRWHLSKWAFWGSFALLGLCILLNIIRFGRG